MSEKENKKISKKQKRIDNYIKIKNNLEKQGYIEQEKTISILKANIMAFLTAGPLFILVLVMYLILYKGINLMFDDNQYFIFCVGVLLSVPIHEFFHGFGWHLFCEGKWKPIHFGVMWSSLTPYCTCTEPLKFKSYMVGGLLPLTMLGLIPSIIGIILGNSLIFSLGAFNILFAGGDTTVAFMMLKYHNKECEILDHPTKCGFIAFIKE